LRTILLFILLLFAHQAAAATIDVVPQTGEEPALIVVQGTLQLDDIDTFRTKASEVTRAVVAFRSDGGNLFAGMRIGRFIRLRNWVTVVPDGTRCASACAIAWLGGSQRFMGQTAQIGFHAAYVSAGGQVTETGAGNAMLGAYLNELGISERAIFYITRANPHSMTWLSLTDAEKYGIDVRIFTATNTTPSKPSIPSGADRGLEQKTAAHINSIFVAWSNSNEKAVEALQQVYASQVTYYGKLLSRQDVLADKRKFIERWPQRRYEIRSSTLATSCDAGRICTVTGLVDWAASNPSSAAHAHGSAEIEYRVLWSEGGPTIIHEAGKVLEREARPAAAMSNQGWWIVLGAFNLNSAPEMIDQGVRSVIDTAAACGIATRTELSSSVTGFASGYKAVLVGALTDKNEATKMHGEVIKCVPGAYLKYGTLEPNSGSRPAMTAKKSGSQKDTAQGWRPW
jgi:ATP-dependent protease ClpP protease subunit